jgi:transcriptional regulator with XRE-family HTH domain
MPSTVNASTSDPHEIGARIKHLREKRGLSMRQLAGEGCTVAYVSVLEQGNRNPSLDALAYLADRLGTSARYLGTGQLEPWQEGLEEAGLELGDLTANEVAVLHRNIADAERHAARILADTVIANRVDEARQHYRNGATLEEAAAAYRCPLQILHDAVTSADGEIRATRLAIGTDLDDIAKGGDQA